MLETLVVLQASNAAYVDVPAILNCRAQACELGQTTGCFASRQRGPAMPSARSDAGL